jgi:hypothetical protein
LIEDRIKSWFISDTFCACIIVRGVVDTIIHNTMRFSCAATSINSKVVIISSDAGNAFFRLGQVAGHHAVCPHTHGVGDVTAGIGIGCNQIHVVCARLQLTEDRSPSKESTESKSKRGRHDLLSVTLETAKVVLVGEFVPFLDEAKKSCDDWTSFSSRERGNLI